MRKQKGWQDIIGTLLYGVAVAVGLILAHILMSDPAAGAQRAPSRIALEVHAGQMENLYGLPVGLLRAICEQESHWRNVAGQHGEIGVCQMKPDTAEMVCKCPGNGRQILLRRGSAGDVVKRIQAELTRHGLYPGRVDGLYGAQTERGVLVYQQLVGERADGIVGPRTWALLFGGETYPGGTIEAALWDPYKNIEHAAAYLAWLIDFLKTDDKSILMAAYNGGPGHPVVKYMVSVQQRMARVEGM